MTRSAARLATYNERIDTLTGKHARSPEENLSLQLIGDVCDARSRVTALENRFQEAEAPPANRDGFPSLGQFLQAVARADTPGARLDPKLQSRTPTGLSEAVPSDGGFLVPTGFATDLLMRTYATGEITSRCLQLPMKPGTNALLVNSFDENSRADGSRFGGVQAFWADEADQIAASHPTFRQMEMVGKKLTGLCYATDETLQDATALQVILTKAFADEFKFKIENAIVSGSGAGRPLGILNSGALIVVPKESGQAAGTILAQNIVNMWSRCWGPSRRDVVWIVNQDVDPALYTTSLTVGTGGAPIFTPAGNVAGSPYAALFGRPVIPVEYCPVLGNLGDVILADFSRYVLADQGMNAATSIHVRFVYDESVFRFTLRVDGQPADYMPLTPLNGAATLSAFVTLQAR